MTEPLTVRILEGANGRLPDIRTQWAKCLKAAPDHQQLFTYDWFDCWLGSYGSRPPWTGLSRCLLVEHPTGEVVAILPLAYRERYGAKLLTLAGFHQPVRGFICQSAHTEAACCAIVTALSKRLFPWDVLRFRAYDAATIERRSLLTEFQRAGGLRLIQEDLGRTFVVRNLPTSPTDFETRVLKQDSVKRILRYERQMRREGEVRLHHYRNPSPAETQQMLEEFRTIEGNSWLMRPGGNPRFMAPHDFAFWQDLIGRTLTPNQQLDAWVAYFNGEPTAFRVSITTGKLRFTIANQYAEKFTKFRLGWILFLQDLADCAARGITSMDSAPGDSYKERWGGEQEDMRVDVFTFPRSIRGTLGYWGYKTYRRLAPFWAGK